MSKSAVLIGNPSVGKSLIFNNLTGLGVEVSNYPGTTVDIMQGVVKYENREFTLIDLPGIYSLSGDAPEEKMVREYLVTQDSDLFIAVIDAKHLERNLYLLLQVTEIQKPLLIVLNMVDEARAGGKEVNASMLSEIFGVPVIESVATEGLNLEKIAEEILEGDAKVPKIVCRFDHHIEAAVTNLRKFHNLSFAESLFALENVKLSTLSDDVMETAQAISEEIEKRHLMSSEQIVGTNRHNASKEIAEKTTKEIQSVKHRDLDSLLTRTFPGVPILIFIMILILGIVFTVGGFLEELIVGTLETYVLVPFSALSLPPLVETLGGSVILAIISGLGIAFPYVFLFYIFISILEDTGYLTRAAFLADRGMHHLGLHGQGLIPLVLSFGCSVPAIMSIRMLPTKRERIIASVLVTMLPCSARTVVISGIVASFVGFAAAFSIYGIIFILVFLIGCILSKVTPGEQYGMILEMAQLRKPVPKMVIKKAWMRVREFLYIAMPLILVSSVFLGLFEYLGWVEMFTSFINPLSETVLGLPGFAFTALLFGILRKEMVIGALADLGGTADLAMILSGSQLYVFAVVCILFVPCISTIAVLAKENGWKNAAVITILTLSVGIVIGAILNFVFMLV
ncbi:MAG: ferrous iron transport protein B [Methanocorpusculum sp.]|nr:ferrous iron transport protein B [Methanocorpusculum sp.]